MKKGFTLMELLVYMAIIAVIVLVAGQAFVDSSKFNVRTRQMIAAAQVASNVSALLREDISQMGVKSWERDTLLDSPDLKAWFRVDSTVYMDVSSTDEETHDSSSYSLKRSGGGSDTLTFRKMVYDGNGEYVGVQEIRWFLYESWNKDMPTLMRFCKTISGTGFDDCPKDDYGLKVAVAENVTEFSVTPSIPGPAPTGASSSSMASDPDGTIFPVPGSSSSNGKFRLLPRSESCDSFECVGNISFDTSFSYAKISNLKTNFDNAAAATPWRSEFYVAEASYSAATWNSDCFEFTFEPHEVYSFEFNMDLGEETNNIHLFQPGKDFFSLGLRKKTDGTRIASAKVNDFTIYPPASHEAASMRYGKFSVAGNSPVKACMAFTIALYSPLTAQNSYITIKKFRVYKAISEVYHFPTGANYYTYNPVDVNAKKRVKAFKIRAQIDEQGEKSLVEAEIPVPSNGARATATK